MTSNHYVVFFYDNEDESSQDNQSFDTLAEAKKCANDTLPHEAVLVAIERVTSHFSANDKLKEHVLEQTYKEVYRRVIPE